MAIPPFIEAKQLHSRNDRYGAVHHCVLQLVSQKTCNYCVPKSCIDCVSFLLSTSAKCFALIFSDEEVRRELHLSLDGPPEFSPSLSACGQNDIRRRGKRLGSEISFKRHDSDMLFVKGNQLAHSVDVDITLQLIMFGYTSEKVELLLSPMAKYASEPLGSMGNDTPSAILSSLPKTFTEYFSQNFAQGTNPPFDAIRERHVISLACPIGKQGDVFSINCHQAKRVFLEEPMLSVAQYRALMTLPGYGTELIDLSWPKSHGYSHLVNIIKDIQKKAEKAVRAGRRFLILSDRRAGPDRFFIWSSLAVGAVHLHLLHQKLRMNCGIIVETGEACEVHQLAFRKCNIFIVLWLVFVLGLCHARDI